jgi:YihY family inner membrane protein
MKAVLRTARRADAFQQRHRPLALLYGVIKKYGDDHAGVLVSNLALAAFAALFPLLLLLVTGLGLVLTSHSGLRADVLHSALNKFPIIGTHLEENIKALHRDSAASFAVGIVGVSWGSLRLAQSGIFAMEQVWDLPGPQRLSYLKRLGRSVAFLFVLLVGLILSTFLAAAVPTARGAVALAILGAALSAIVNFGEYLFAFRVLTPGAVPLRNLVPGAALGGTCWTLLQALGGYVVGHYLRNANALYGLFGIVLGLLAWVYLIAELSVYSAELNVVLARRLWPRAILPPPLTDADRRALTAEGQRAQLRPEQDVQVTFRA